MSKPRFKEKVRHELSELLAIITLLAPFLVSFALFRHYLEGKCGAPFSFGSAILAAFINAWVLAKVILIGEAAKIGKNSEGKPLIYATLHKSAMFTALYLILHVIEVVGKAMLHGKSLVDAFHSAIDPEELIVWFVVVFCAFLPFFALRGIRRVVGANEFRNMFIEHGVVVQK
jgi:hypothetical protein